jgi:2-dehydro-3-deoxyphosphogalactonate aldolase
MGADMTALTEWQYVKRPLVAILRGVRPDEILPIADALYSSGFEAIEVPLNSPDPFESIIRLQKTFKGRCLCGAGTVLTVDEVDRLAETGARLCISPNADVNVISKAVERGMISLPGVFTATEALAAAKAGASGLKFFPASILGPDGMKAISAVLPPGLQQIAVGGVSDQDFAGYGAAGINAFGLGSSIYKPGDAADVVGASAIRTVAAWDAVFG